MQRIGAVAGEILLAIVVALAIWLAVADMTAQAALPEMTGSQVLTIERSDAGELYAALSIVLEAALAPRWSLVIVHDQAAQWPGGRYAEWDVALAWRPWDGWSISAGRRSRVGPPPDYGGPRTYVQVWYAL